MIITVIKAEIEAEAGWAVGAADADAPGLDRELLTEPDGRAWVPPSSLAGSLRAHLASRDADERLMGSRPPREGARRPGAPAPHLTPSALWVLGTSAHRAGTDRRDRDAADPGTAGEPGIRRGGQAPAPRTGVVASTAVDPARGGALPKSLRHSRIVDEATMIEFYALLEGKLTADDEQLLGTWQPQVGRDRTRGGGAAKLRRLGWRTYDLREPTDLRAWLEAAGPGRFTALTPIKVRTAGPEPALPGTEFVITHALHVGTGSRRQKDKAATVRTRGASPLVPASTWKGLFRSRAGYIIRSCWGERAACTCQTGCGECPLCDVFGSATKRGRLAFRDSTITASQQQTRTHVAIDRISGGGRDKLLFTDEVVVAGRVTLTITCLGPVAEWERNLLLSVVRDIHDGLIGIGGGSQRGQGTLLLASTSHPAITSLQPMPAMPPAAEATHD
jgi:CRISPR/Cas system CSM-associated protein Csm3 (group 7 of RAMP superfamily)